LLRKLDGQEKYITLHHLNNCSASVKRWNVEQMPMMWPVEKCY